MPSAFQTGASLRQRAGSQSLKPKAAPQGGKRKARFVPRTAAPARLWREPFATSAHFGTRNEADGKERRKRGMGRTGLTGARTEQGGVLPCHKGYEQEAS